MERLEARQAKTEWVTPIALKLDLSGYPGVGVELAQEGKVAGASNFSLVQRTNAYQRNDNLMLSAEARADSIPGLEIEADDVRCTHGATAGRVDDEQLFYAQARGLSRKEAARLIVSGFFQQVFDRITIENVREALATAIDRRVREIG